jgi:hypothetical protein
MSFIQTPEFQGKGWEAGYFLVDDENCTRVTAEISASHAAVVTRADGSKYVPAGSIIPSNNSSAVGILYENVDVTAGNAPGSIVVAGYVYKDRLPVVVDSDAVTAMTGIKWDTYEPTIARPDFKGGTLSAITVASVAGTGEGKTDVSLSGYTPKSGEKYYIKTGTAVAPTFYGMVLDNTWTNKTFPMDEYAPTSGHTKITVVSVDAFGFVVAAGNDDITVKE